MNRHSSRSQLASPASQAKIKRAIHQAMGRPTRPPTENSTRPLRSQSTKSLRSFNGSMLNTSVPYGYSGTHRKQSQQKLRGESPKSYCAPQQIMRSWEWWHRSNAQLITQQKVKVTGVGKQNLKYFAYLNEGEKQKRIIAALQNNQLHPGCAQHQVLLVHPARDYINLSAGLKPVQLPARGSFFVIIMHGSEPWVQKVYEATNAKLKQSKNMDKIFEYLMEIRVGSQRGEWLLLLRFGQQMEFPSKKVEALCSVIKGQKMRKKLMF